MILSVAAILQWVGLIQQLAPRWAQFKAFLAENGIAEDTAALDAVIIDAERRKAIAEAEAAGGSQP